MAKLVSSESTRFSSSLLIMRHKNKRNFVASQGGHEYFLNVWKLLMKIVLAEPRDTTGTESTTLID